MTPDEISKLSNQQLNELIAVKRGYENIPEALINDEWVKGSFWSKQGVGYFEKHAPDYCTSWQYAGELLEEIIAKMNLTKIRVFKDEVDHQEAEFWLEKEYSILTLNWHKSDLKPRKIAEAYAVMECVG